MAGRLRTASRPSKTVMDFAPYSCDCVLTDLLFLTKGRGKCFLPPALFATCCKYATCCFFDGFFFPLTFFTTFLAMVCTRADAFFFKRAFVFITPFLFV